MKISFITCSYNSANSIINTIESVNKQTYKNIEHIFVDGGSTDNTVDIIRSTSMRINKVITEKDRGIYDGLNKGIELATGDVIGFVHSDDILAANNIASIIANRFIKNDIDGVYGDLQYVKGENFEKVIRYWRGKEYHEKLINKGWMPAHPTLFLARHIYETVGLFDLSFKIAADYDFVLRLLKRDNIKLEYLPTIITKMSIGGASNRNLRNIILKSKEDYRALKKNEINKPFKLLINKNLSKVSQFITR